MKVAYQLTSTGWGSSTIPVGISQEQLSTASSAANSAASPATSPFEDSARKWLALRSFQSSSEVGVVDTSLKSSAQPSRTLLEPPTAPNALKRPERVIGLKRWTGLVLEIADDWLTIELTPTDHEGPRFQAEFELSLLAPDDAVAQPGDIVYLTTRFVRATSGYSTVTTQLRLRRAGRWSEKEVGEIQELARQHAAYFEHVE